MPGQNGWDLSLLTRDGDFDGDGISNWQEYIAGTFATDPTDYLSLRVTEALTAPRPPTTPLQANPGSGLFNSTPAPSCSPPCAIPIISTSSPSRPAPPRAIG